MRQTGSWTPFQYPIRRLIVRYRKALKPQDFEFKVLRHFEILHARVGSKIAEVPVKFQGDRITLNANLAASRLYEILQ